MEEDGIQAPLGEKSILWPIKTLQILLINNIEHYQTSKSKYAEHFFTTLCHLEQETDALKPVLEAIEQAAGQFDFDPSIPGNGYRSLLTVVEKCVGRVITLCQTITRNRDSMMFRGSHYCKELDAYSRVMSQLRRMLTFAQKLLCYSDSSELFITDKSEIPETELLLAQALDRECFYGRCLGFQFSDIMYKPLQTVAIAMASFSEGYHRYDGVIGRTATTLYHSGKYMLNPEQRAKRIVEMTTKCDVTFCKSFWSITEASVVSEMSGYMAGPVAVNRVIQISPHNFEMPSMIGGESVTITPPCAHTGPGLAQMRLLSFHEREGQAWLFPPPKSKGESIQNKQNKVQPSPLSSSLLIHFHGGGFVAQTSKSHEIYLRNWCKELGVPIVSVDYSLAPEAPFPRAFEECFFAYAWAVQNAPHLGSTGERICIAGDSAGGNLAISVAMRAASYGIRAPDGVVAAYAPLMISTEPSPSRIMSIMDPLLPLGILMTCISSYAGIKEEFEDEHYVKDIVAQANDKINGMTASRSDTEGRVFKNGDVSPAEKENTDTSNGEIPLQVLANNSAKESPIMEEVSPSQILTDINDKTCNKNDVDDNVATLITEDSTNVSTSEETAGESCDSAVINTNTGESVTQSNFSPMVSVRSDDVEESPVDLNPDNIPIPQSISRDSLSLDLDDESFGVIDTAVLEPPAYIDSPVRKFKESPIFRNGYLSPLKADDELLKGLPPVHLLSATLDPLCDDSVAFAKRLKKLEKPVHLEFIDDLPHGFLNFQMAGKETREASLVCIRHIMEVFHGVEEEKEWVEIEASGNSQTQ
ncbi:hormone-sensitive lipase-like [Antedon mediterranea]|uniref:hormone-sensitive lipase-like n=1 Tax=Antedon mediterranea TaxID=105859 RepID=UPI003AF71846